MPFKYFRSVHITLLSNCLIFANDLSDVLSINHLDQVRQAIWEGRIEWRNLGLELKLSPDTLKAISKKYPQSIDECFVEMLSEWLRSGCRPTWEDMIWALRSPIVGLQALAIKLEKETGKVPSPPLDLLHSLFLVSQLYYYSH